MQLIDLCGQTILFLQINHKTALESFRLVAIHYPLTGLVSRHQNKIHIHDYLVELQFFGVWQRCQFSSSPTAPMLCEGAGLVLVWSALKTPNVPSAVAALGSRRSMFSIATGPIVRANRCLELSMLIGSRPVSGLVHVLHMLNCIKNFNEINYTD